MNSSDFTLFLDWSDICHKVKGLGVLACGTKTLRTTYSSKNKSEQKNRAQNKLEGFFQSSAGRKMVVVIWFGFLPSWYIINPLCTSFQVSLFRILEEHDKSGQVESRPLFLHTELLLCVTSSCYKINLQMVRRALSIALYDTAMVQMELCRAQDLGITYVLFTSK